MTRLLFFGHLRDVAGHRERLVDLPAHVRTVTELRSWISEMDPHLGEAVRARGLHIAIDQVICNHGDGDVCGASEIAFMPPLSGG